MEDILEIRNLNKRFGKKLVLDNINLSFKKASYGLLGANGVGKTTLLRCITRHYNEGDRAIFFRGKELYKYKDYTNHLGYLPQRFGGFSELSVTDNLLLFCQLRKLDKKFAENRIKTCLELVKLERERNTPLSALSGGMLRRLGIAQALLPDPEILILDEPTVGLDPEERVRFHNIIRYIQGEKLIIISTHIVEDLESVSDQVIMMDNKGIGLVGASADLVRTAEGKVYNVSVQDELLLQGKYIICKRYEHEGLQMLRVVAKKNQNFSLAKAKLEDAYIAFVNKIE